jgi:hypothetical protein
LTQTIVLNVLGHTAIADAMHANTRLALIGVDTARQNAKRPSGSVDVQNKKLRQTTAGKNALSLITCAICRTTAIRIRLIQNNNAVVAQIFDAQILTAVVAVTEACNALVPFLASSMGHNAISTILLLS